MKIRTSIYNCTDFETLPLGILEQYYYSLLEKSSCFQIFYKIFIPPTYHCVVLVILKSKLVWLALLDCTGRKRGKRKKGQEKHRVVQPSFPHSVCELLLSDYYQNQCLLPYAFFHSLLQIMWSDQTLRNICCTKEF